MNASNEMIRDPGAQVDNGMARDAERIFLSMGDGAAPRPLGGSKLSQPMVVAGFVVMLAVGALGGMHVFGPRAATADDLPQYAASTHSASDAQRARDMIDALQRSSRPMQFTSTLVLASPFAEPFVETKAVEKKVDSEAEIAERQRRELVRRFEKLELNSVLGGTNPVARINQSVYREGDLVDEVFTVVQITGRGVLLTADEQRFVLVPKSGG